MTIKGIDMNHGPLLLAHPGDTWRECPQCGGVQILSGNPVLSSTTPQVEFMTIDLLQIACSNCGYILPSQ